MFKSLIIVFVLAGFVFTNSGSAQKKRTKTTTIILLRHAEKDTTAAGNNPPLSTEGLERAKRLPASFPKIVPDEFYSTSYIRTVETLKPWAEALRKEIKIYAVASSFEFAEELRKQKGKTIVVAGHSNTIPVLVNLLIGAEKYKTLADSTYGNVYVVTVKNGKAKEKILHY